MNLDFLFQLAVIMLTAKLFGILMRRIGLPQVLGFIIAGILVAPAIWGLFIGENPIFPIRQSEAVSVFAEVGVILVMFTAGLETDLKELKNTGFISFLVALGGVLVPLGLGFLTGMLFLPKEGALTWLFVGVIITATSVGITVETLRELGKLKSKVGTVILSAAIIDDVLGIIILSIALSLNGANGDSSPVLQAINPNGLPIISILWMCLYFVVAIGLGILLSKLFKLIEKKHPHTRRIPIFSVVVCFLYAYVAEKVFGVAEITGAYIAGAGAFGEPQIGGIRRQKDNHKSYMFFAPIFFASIGIKIDFTGFTWHILLFALVFVIAAISGKIIGCGGMAKLCKFGWKDSLRIGAGMIARGEVALIVTEKGIAGGLLPAEYRAIVVALVLVSTVLAPILLKLLYKNDTAGAVPFSEITPPKKEETDEQAD